MPCEKCGHKLILGKTKNELICPKCKKIDILPKEIALKVFKKRIDWFNNAFTQVLRKFDKRRLITWLVSHREKMVEEFFHGKPILPIEDFLAVNALIKWVIKDYDVIGGEEANEKNTPELIDSFSKYVDIARKYYLILDDYAYVIAKEIFTRNDLEKRDYKWLMNNFFVVYDEEWKIILDTLNLHNIVNKKDAEEYFKKHEEEYKQAIKPQKLESLTVEETIEGLYPTMIQFLYGLQLNIYFKTVFDFGYLKNTGITPKHLLKIVTSLREVSGGINVIKPPRELKRFIRKNFKEIDKHKTYDLLVFSKDNQGIFPIFIRLDDYLFIPINTTKIISIFLYPFIYNKEFIRIHNKKSEEFEKKEVKELFEKKGFETYSNYKDKEKNPTLEIDLLALKEGALSVTEVKAWDIKPFFEGRRIHEYRERDLKGVVDGTKYTEGNPKPIPSLLKKIEHVKENIEVICQKCGFNKDGIKLIKGLVVTKSFPPIKDYKDIKFISKAEI